MLNPVFISDFLDDPASESAFLKMYYHYEKTLMSIAMNRVHNYHIAEECVSEALIKIAKNFDKIKEPVSKETKSYICRIVDNTAIDAFHKEIERPLSDAEFSEEDFWQQAEESFEKSVNAQELSFMLDELPDDVKNYLVLHYYNNMTLKEISKTFGISYYLLSKKINEALVNLKGEDYE